ncbi:hypothetical protein X975_21793, partial [Stegodyphus mimosarum]
MFVSPKSNTMNFTRFFVFLLTAPTAFTSNFSFACGISNKSKFPLNAQIHFCTYATF